MRASRAVLALITTSFITMTAPACYAEIAMKVSPAGIRTAEP